MKILIAKISLIFLFLFITQASHAACTATNATLSFSSIGQGNSTGDVLGTASTTVNFTCTDKGATSPAGVYNNWSFQTLGAGASSAVGSFDKVFATNVPGVGITFRETSTNKPINSTDSFCWAAPRVGDPCYQLPECPMPGTCVLTIQGQLIRTGSVTPGPLSGTVMNLSFYAFGATNGTNVGTITIGGTVTSGTCSMRDMSVNLGNASSSTFRSIGDKSRTISNSDTVVNLTCSSSTSSVTLAFSSATAADSSSGVIRSSASSTSSGIGIILMRQDGTSPLRFDRQFPVDLVGTSVGKTGSFPFTAAMTKLSDPVVPGIVNGAVVVTMSVN